MKAELLALNRVVWTSPNSTDVTMINRVSDKAVSSSILLPISLTKLLQAIISLDTPPVTATAQIFPNAHQLDINGGTYSNVARDQIINIHPSLPGM